MLSRQSMSAPTLAGKLVVAISSRALFDLTESHRVYTDLGVESYHRYQIEHEDELLAPGPAFALVTKLLRLNRLSKQYVEVILLSRNSADTGLRVFNAIKHYGLDITRAAFTKGEPTSRYVPAFGAHLFLSADTEDVRRALEDGYAAATIFPSVFRNETDELRIAFDGDAVLFSDEAERVYQTSGLAAFAAERARRGVDAADGRPVQGVSRRAAPDSGRFSRGPEPDPHRARHRAQRARARARHPHAARWNIRIDEALFLGGLDKGEFLRAFGADIFFDDQTRHVESAAQHVSAGPRPARHRQRMSRLRPIPCIARRQRLTDPPITPGARSAMLKIRRSHFIRLALGAAAACAFALPALADDYKIGVHPHRAPPARIEGRPRRRTTRIEQEFKARDAERRASSSSELRGRNRAAREGPRSACTGGRPHEPRARARIARRATLERLRQQFTEDLRARQFEELDKLKERLDSVLTRLAKEQRLRPDPAGRALRRPIVDITDDVIKALEAK